MTQPIKAFALNLTQAVTATPVSQSGAAPMIVILQQNMHSAVICGQEELEILMEACRFALKDCESKK